MAHTLAFQPLRRVTPFLSAVALLSLLTACGDAGDSTTAVQTSAGTSSRTTASAPSDTGSGTTEPAPSGHSGRTTGPAASTARCHTSELRASIGRPDAGAGQRNFPIVLTSTASRTCTVHGYPGAAFVDASGKQLGPDPKRSPDRATTITLAPGRSAWAGLSFASPEISGARTATPKALLVTPPDERASLKVVWTAGAVPVAGNESSVFLTVLQPGTGG
jgi:hypothetical protein